MFIENPKTSQNELVNSHKRLRRQYFPVPNKLNENLSEKSHSKF